MKVVILAGGLGTRLSEETVLKPKPMVEIGGMPILWHIMKTYSSYGFNDFVICLGYKGYLIKEYFSNYFLHQNDVTFDLEKNETTYHRNGAEPWRVTLVDTGLDVQTGCRIKRIENYLDGPFFLTYGDAVARVNIKKLLEFHQTHGRVATMTAVAPESRFGVLEVDEETSLVTKFKEKPQNDETWINGGFFVFEKEFLNILSDDPTLVLEKGPLENLVERQELGTFKLHDFWKCMDTVRDRLALEDLWKTDPQWKVWSP